MTICNLNPFKKSALDESPELSALLNAYEATLEEKASSSSNNSSESKRKKRQSCSEIASATHDTPDDASGKQTNE